MPLIPSHVAALRGTGCRVVVQPSARRVFNDSEFQRAGAEVRGRLADCDVILGVKEIDPAEILPGKTYAFFSHTTKGQAGSAALLRRLIDAKCTLIDYEFITDGEGRRLVYFGRHAGYAGMINTLWALGRRLQHESIRTPLQQIQLAHEYQSLNAATSHIRHIGEEIRAHGLPAGLRPIVFAVAGSGQVAQGARKILNLLPCVEIDAENLAALPEDRDLRRNVVYLTHLERHHRYERIDDRSFDGDEFLDAPSQYTSALGPLLRHITVLVNGTYWEPGFPRLVGNAHLIALWDEEPQPKLRVIGDITCDVGGSVEATVTATTPDDPVFVYDLDVRTNRPGVSGSGPVIMAVDNLPAEIPAESSEFFSDALMQFLPNIIHCDWSRSFSTLLLPESLRRAVIVHQGRLTPDYAHLDALLETA